MSIYERINAKCEDAHKKIDARHERALKIDAEIQKRKEDKTIPREHIPVHVMHTPA